MKRKTIEKIIRHMLKHIPDKDMENLLTIVQEYAAPALNQRYREEQLSGGK